MRQAPFASRAVKLVLIALSLACLAGTARAILCEFLSSPTDEQSQPRAIVETSEQDFGRAIAGASLEARFAVRNAGTRRLVLRQLNGSCDCLVSVPEILIEPGCQHDLSAQLDTAQLEGPARIEFGYRTNDPKCPQLKLSILADVRRP